MAKQSWKQQMMQQIANKQVQQVMQQKQAEQLQASFNAWQKEQDDIAKLQASFDAWQKENVQPVQQPAQPVQTVKKEQPKQEVIPSLADYFKPTTASGRDINKEAAKKQSREDYQRQQQKEAMLASQGAMKGEAKWDRSVDNTLNMLNTDEFKNVVKKGKVQKAIEEKEQKQKTQDKIREKQIASLDKYNTDNLPQLTDEQKALEEQILNADRYVDNTPSKDRWNNRFLTAQEKADAINKTTQEDVDRWLSPDTKLTNKEKGKARAYASNEIQKMQRDAKHQPIGTEEEKQHYADMVEILNKTNPISSAMSGYMELPFNLVDMAGDAGKSVVNQIGGLGAAVTDKLGITEGATQRHNEKVEAANEAADLKEANQRRSFANAQTQYPLANTGGKFAGQVTMYALTNPVFDGIAEGAGVTNQLAKFFINQGAQNAQDLALDTAPLVKELMADGSMSDADKREVFNNVLLNALGNAAMGTAQEIPNITKYVGKKIDAKKAADAAFRDNVLAGADNLAKLANEDIPILQDADNVVARATRQAEVSPLNVVPNAEKAEIFAKQGVSAEADGFIPTSYHNSNGVDLPTQKAINNLSNTPKNVVNNGDNFKEFVEEAANSKGKYKRFYYGTVSDELANDIKNSLGIETKGMDIVYDTNHIQHIIKEHGNDAAEALRGQVGVTTDSIADSPRVFDNPDKIEWLDGTNSDGNRVFAVTKRVDNTYYVATGYKDPKNQLMIDSFRIKKNPLKTDYATDAAQSLRLNANSKSGSTLDITDGIDNVNKKSVNFDDTKLSDAEINRLLSGMEPAKTIEPPKAPEVIEPEIPRLLSDDVESQLAYDFENLGDSYYGNRAAIREALENKDFSMPNIDINEVPGKNGKMQYEIIDLDTNRKIKSFASRKAAEKAQAEYIAGDVLKEKAIKAFEDIDAAIYNYEKAAYNSADVEEVNTAKKAVEAARKRYERAMKELDPTYYDAVSSKDFGDRITRPYYTRNPAAENPIDEALQDELVNDWVKQDIENPNRFVKDANNVPGAEPLQTFADGQKNGDWKISKARTNTFENQGWGDQLPEKDYAYRVQSTAEQHEIKAERYRDSENIARDLLSKDFDTFDAADVKASMEEIQSLMDNGEIGTARRLSERLAHEGRESGRTIQAFKEYNKNSLSGALLDADSAQESFVLEPWRSKNKKAREGNSRIAKALADMGHKTDAKIKPELTHDQIKNGVIAELNREVGSVEQYFNDNDIEFLTQLAEDKSVPVWQITSEIEHKLNTGNWYTLDESIAMPKPTNRKLQNALNSLVTETIRTESETPSLKQIAEEVRNTLGKESADLEGLFTDDDMDYLANLIHEGATKEELAQALDMKMATGSWGISDETLQEVNNIFKQISQYDTNSKQFVEGQAEAYRLLANEILPNATLREKFEAWRYIAMLGNPKTMLRNFIGNQTFNVVTGISNNVAAVAEAGIDKAARALGGEGIQRTKAVLNPIADSGLIKAAAEDADASRYRQIIGSKYEKMSKDTLKQSKSVFNSKLAQLYEKVTDAGISDYSAVKKKYSTSLAGYMKANGMDTNIFKAEDELRRLKEISNTRLLSNAEKSQMDSLTKQVADLNKARDYALKQAEYATFHEDNAIANVLSKWSRTSKEEGTGLGHVLIEGVVPFKKTPANVLKSGYEYSPLGAISSIKKTGKLIYENTGKRAGNLADVYKNSKGKDVARTLASDVIDSWSKTLTGTGLTALGFYLYNKGILHSSDPDTKYQDQLEGHQNYAIEINGKSYTVDWAAPTIMPLMVGAEIAKLWDSTAKGDGDFYKNIDGYMNAANRLADPLIETSMLSGVKDTLETAASAAQYNENLNVPTLLAYNTITGYATQGIPTLGGQIARTIDPTRRSTYTDKEGVAGILDKQTKKLMNKIPGLSYLNEPYVDTYGREQQNSPFNNPAGNLAYQMLSPGYLSNINETGADNVSREAYAVGNTESTLPKWQSKFKDASGNRVSPEDYTKASKAYGQANYEIREALAKDKWFNGLDDAQKEEIVKGINTIAQHVGNAAIDPNYSKDSKPYNAYKDGGIKGLLDYYKGQEAKNTTKDLLGDSGVTTNSKAGKAIQAAVESGDMKQAEKLAAEAKEEKAQEKQTEATKEDLSSYGLTSITPAKTYEKAQGVIPGLTMESFAKTYKAIDSDGNQGIKQDEIISYLNSHNVSESEGKKIWEAYGNKTWKKIPVLNNGKWKKSG